VKVHYIACAKSSSVDNKTNQLSLFHILDEVGAAAFPLHLQSFCVAALFEREPEEAEVQSFVLAIHLNATLIASFTMQVDFTRSRRNRSVHTIQGLTIPAAGAVSITLTQKSRQLAEWRARAAHRQSGAAGAARDPRRRVERPQTRPGEDRDRAELAPDICIGSDPLAGAHDSGSDLRQRCQRRAAAMLPDPLSLSEDGVFTVRRKRPFRRPFWAFPP
jgi:hypothetical protein